ncbi:MAG: glycosyltransferase family 25 protein [Verrucomicrobiota bacterium]
MSTPATSTLWSRLDGIAVVNLDDRPDRWETVRAAAESALPGAPPLTRISAVRGTSLPGFGVPPWFRGKKSDKRWGSKVGCTQSHRRVMEHAREHRWDLFLVLEDDADFSPLASVDLTALEAKLFDTHPDWDVCYLGFSKATGTSLQLAKFGDHRLCAMSGCYTTHAYLVRARARDWIYQQLAPDAQAWTWHAEHRIIDRWYTRHLSFHVNVFAVSPSPISQAPGFSDIVQRQVDYTDEFSGNLADVTTDPAVFRRTQTLRRLRLLWLGGWDKIRALGKRCRGF